MKEKPDCTHCRQLKEMYHKDPLCAECMPILQSGNIDAAKIYFLVERQVIIDFGQVIDIKHEPIHLAMELYRVEDRVDCFEKIIHVFNIILQEQHAEARAKD